MLMRPPGPWEIGLILAIIPIAVALVILPFWKIFSKAGFSGWLSLTLLVPIVDIVVLFYLAFTEWPVQRELNRMKQGSYNAKRKEE